MRQVYWEFWEDCCGRMWTVRIGTRASCLTIFFYCFPVFRCVQDFKPWSHASSGAECQRFGSTVESFSYIMRPLLNVEFDWVLYHTCRPHGQETLADVYKSIRPEELATLAPQHHCDMLDYVGSMVGVLCSCKHALCWFTNLMNEFWNISPKI